jgi:hypothetical protein
MPTSKNRSTPTSSAAPATPTTSEGPKGKLGILVQLLSRPEGAEIAEMSEATGWQAHSVRGAIAGALKKRGFAVASENAGNTRVYRISGPAAVATPEQA